MHRPAQTSAPKTTILVTDAVAVGQLTPSYGSTRFGIATEQEEGGLHALMPEWIQHFGVVVGQARRRRRREPAL